MNTKRKRTRRQVNWLLKLRSYSGFVDQACELEAILSRKPSRLRIDLIGAGEMPADAALLIRSILFARADRTHLTTNARSSLRGGAVLVWLLGDRRLIRDDARLFFRAAGPFESGDPQNAWKDRGLFDDDDLEAANYIRVLQAINEFLPVKELAGQAIEPSVLKQFGLVDHEKVDNFLAAAFRKEDPPDETPRSPRVKPVRPDVPL